MEWSKIVKLNDLGSKRDKSPEDKDNFHKFVVDNLDQFDPSAWSIFCHSVTVNPDKIKEDKNFWKKVVPELKKVDLTFPNFSMNAAMRLQIIMDIYEDV